MFSSATKKHKGKKYPIIILPSHSCENNISRKPGNSLHLVETSTWNQLIRLWWSKVPWYHIELFILRIYILLWQHLCWLLNRCVSEFWSFDCDFADLQLQVIDGQQASATALCSHLFTHPTKLKTATCHFSTTFFSIE